MNGFTYTNRLGRNIALGMTVAGFAVAAAGASKAEDLIVKYDQSQLLRLPRPAAEIIIGNPTIADISVQSGNLLVITGKTFGITNIIALDADRNVIQDQRVLVKRDESKVVNLQRGTQRQSYNCTPQCNPSITIGDEQKFFDAVTAASQKKVTFSSSGIARANAPSVSGRSPTMIPAPVMRSRTRAHIGSYGLPATTGATPDAVATAARIEPPPGMGPSGVG